MMITPPMQALLAQLEQALRDQQCWQQEPPSQQALSSQQPFAVDTLAPQEWLQWIFIPKMTQLLESGQTLPKGFEMSPYFEQTWQQQEDMKPVIAVIRLIEQECA